MWLNIKITCLCLVNYSVGLLCFDDYLENKLLEKHSAFFGSRTVKRSFSVSQVTGAEELFESSLNTPTWTCFQCNSTFFWGGFKLWKLPELQKYKYIHLLKHYIVLKYIYLPSKQTVAPSRDHSLYCSYLTLTNFNALKVVTSSHMSHTSIHYLLFMLLQHFPCCTNYVLYDILPYANVCSALLSSYSDY